MILETDKKRIELAPTFEQVDELKATIQKLEAELKEKDEKIRILLIEDDADVLRSTIASLRDKISELEAEKTQKDVKS